MSQHKDTFTEKVNNSIESIKSDYKDAVTNLNYAINNLKYECKTVNKKNYRIDIDYLKVKV